jgi:hypothetical protein
MECFAGKVALLDSKGELNKRGAGFRGHGRTGPDGVTGTPAGTFRGSMSELF